MEAEKKVDLSVLLYNIIIFSLDQHHLYVLVTAIHVGMEVSEITFHITTRLSMVQFGAGSC